MKNALSVLMFLTLATNAEALRAQTEGVVARPVESITTQLPENGRSMFDRGPRPTPVAPVEEVAPKDAAKSSDSQKPNVQNAPTKTADELSYEAIWNGFLGTPRTDIWSPNVKTGAPSLAPDETWVKMCALQTAQNTKLLEQNELLLKQNEQIIALLKQIAGIKTVTKIK